MSNHFHIVLHCHTKSIDLAALIKCLNVLQAVQLLKKGGVLVYSTCTVTLAENEEQVAWALQTFPCLTLQPQVKTLQPRGQTPKYGG